MQSDLSRGIGQARQNLDDDAAASLAARRMAIVQQQDVTTGQAASAPSATPVTPAITPTAPYSST